MTATGSIATTKKEENNMSLKSKLEDITPPVVALGIAEEIIDRLEKMIDRSIKAQMEARKLEQEFILKLVQAGGQLVLDGQKSTVQTQQGPVHTSPVPSDKAYVTPTVPGRSTLREEGFADKNGKPWMP